MFEKFSRAGWPEFRQRYEGTFGFFRNNQGKKTLVKLVRVGDIRCEFSGEGDVQYHIVPDAEDDVGFEFIPPKAAYYNVEGKAVLIERIPARQYRRGVHAANTAVANLLAKGGFGQIPLDFDILKKIYVNPTAYSLAMANFENCESVAVSPQFALSVKNPKVFVFDKMIGTYKKKDNHFVLSLDEPNLWRVELTDAFRSVNCTVEVS